MKRLRSGIKVHITRNPSPSDFNFKIRDQVSVNCLSSNTTNPQTLHLFPLTTSNDNAHLPSPQECTATRAPLPPLEEPHDIRRIRRPRLGDIPMLDQARPVHAVEIDNRRLRVSIDPHMHDPEAVVEVPALDVEVRVRDDGLELGGHRVAALGVVGAVPDDRDVDMAVKGRGDFLVGVPRGWLAGRGGRGKAEGGRTTS